MKKRIMLICEALGGGVRRHILDILNDPGLTRKYDFFLVYSPNRADDVFKEHLPGLIEKGIKCFEVKSLVRNLSPKQDWQAFLEVSRIIRIVKPDVVHCHSSKAGAIGRLAAFHKKIGTIYYTPHGYAAQGAYLSRQKKRMYAYFEKILSKFTTLTINVSQGEKDFAVRNKIIEEEKTVVIYNGVTDEEANGIARDYKKKGDPITIGCAARYTPDKNPRLFYEIAKHICLNHQNVRFIYFGDGDFEKKQLECLVRREKLQDRIQFHGFEKDVGRLLKTIDIFLSTSTNEALPYALIEALAHRLPIVATNITGNNEIVVDGFNGFLFESGNAMQGVEKIERLLASPELMKTFGDNAFSLFLEKFRLDEMIRKLNALYDH